MKKSVLLSAWIMIVGGALFIGAWAGYAEFIRKEAERLLLETQQQGWYISGTAITVTGFPKPHVVRWSGQIWQKSTIIKVPLATLTGWPVPKSHFTLETPMGFYVLEKGVEILNADLLRLQLEVPADVPLTINEAGMRGWQQRGGKINITDLAFKVADLSATGRGFFQIDEMLQPAGRLDFRFTNPDGLLALIQERTGGNMAYSLAKTFIDSTRLKDEMGADYVPLPLQIVNQTVYVGPLRVSKLNTIRWGPQDTRPAP